MKRTIREFITEYLMCEYPDEEVLLDVDAVYLRVKQQLNYIFNDRDPLEKSEEKIESLIVNPYEVLSSRNRYDFNEKQDQIKFADTLTKLLKLYYFVLDRFYLKKETNRKAQYKMVYDLFENIRSLKLDLGRWFEEIERVYEAIKMDPNSTTEIITATELIKRIPIIETYNVDFSDIKCGFTTEFKTNTGIFNETLQSRAYEHLKRNFIQVIEVCWLVLTDNNVLDMELSDIEQEFWEYLYLNLLESSDEEDEKEGNDKKKNKKKLLSFIAAGKWEKIDIEKRKEIWDYIQRMTRESTIDVPSDHARKTDGIKKSGVVQENGNCEKKEDLELPEPWIRQALQELLKIYDTLSNVSNWRDLMDHEAFLSTKKDFYKRIQQLTCQLHEAAYYDLKDLEEQQDIILPKEDKSIVDLHCVANRYIQAIEAEELNDRLEMIKMKLLNPKLYRFWSNLSDLYVEVTGSVNMAHLIREDVLDTLGNRMSRARSLYCNNYEVLDEPDCFFDTIEQFITRKI